MKMHLAIFPASEVDRHNFQNNFPEVEYLEDDLSFVYPIPPEYKYPEKVYDLVSSICEDLGINVTIYQTTVYQ